MFMVLFHEKKKKKCSTASNKSVKYNFVFVKI